MGHDPAGIIRVGGEVPDPCHEWEPEVRGERPRDACRVTGVPHDDDVRLAGRLDDLGEGLAVCLSSGLAVSPSALTARDALRAIAQLTSPDPMVAPTTSPPVASASPRAQAIAAASSSLATSLSRRSLVVPSSYTNISSGSRPHLYTSVTFTPGPPFLRGGRALGRARPRVVC